MTLLGEHQKIVKLQVSGLSYLFRNLSNNDVDKEINQYLIAKLRVRYQLLISYLQFLQLSRSVL